MRVEATRSARPVPASQAENVSMRIGMMVEDGVCVWIGHIVRATYIDMQVQNSILLYFSKQLGCVYHPRAT